LITKDTNLSNHYVLENQVYYTRKGC